LADFCSGHLVLGIEMFDRTTFLDGGESIHASDAASFWERIKWESVLLGCKF
jgi:hypothetical protein